MQAGIGGRTIAEARQRISYTEALTWQAYIRKRGTLHVGRRVEVGTAAIAHLLGLVNGRTISMEALAPHEQWDDTPEPEGPQDVPALLAAVAAELGGKRQTDGD